MQAGALVAKHRVTPLGARTPQRLLQLGNLSVGYIAHTLALPYRTATEALHTLGEDYLITSPLEQRSYDLHLSRIGAVLMVGAHSLIDAAWIIDHLQRVVGLHALRRVCLFDTLWHRVGQWHRLTPQRSTSSVHYIGHLSHNLVAQHSVSHISKREDRSQTRFHPCKMVSGKLAHTIAYATLWERQRPEVVCHLAHIYLKRTAC